eukprot:1157953-Pelagomonas_calceolata.AAC.2
MGHLHEASKGISAVAAGAGPGAAGETQMCTRVRCRHGNHCCSSWCWSRCCNWGQHVLLRMPMNPRYGARSKVKRVRWKLMLDRALHINRK